ncbi:MAG: ATP phosphoribosyltransferase regulatory subunit, partial [Cytophagales bacterium]
MDKPSLPKGTRDFGPAQMAKRYYILDRIKKVFQKYGFQPLETPAMENLSTLTGKYGDEGDQLLFKILDSGDYLSKLKYSIFDGKAKREIVSLLRTIFLELSRKIFETLNDESCNKIEPVSMVIEKYYFESIRKNIDSIPADVGGIIVQLFRDDNLYLADKVIKFLVNESITRENRKEKIDRIFEQDSEFVKHFLEVELFDRVKRSFLGFIEEVRTRR